MNSNCSSLLYLRNIQKQVKKHSVTENCSVQTNCSSDLKNFENSQPSASNFKKISQSLEQFFLTVGQNNFGNKIPLLISYFWLVKEFVKFWNCFFVFSWDLRRIWTHCEGYHLKCHHFEFLLWHCGQNFLFSSKKYGSYLPSKSENNWIQIFTLNFYPNI